MAFIPVAATVKAEMLYTQNGQNLANVLHYTMTDPSDETQQTTLAAAMVNAVTTSGGLRALWRTTCTLQMIRITSLVSETAPGIEFVTGLPIVGSNELGSTLPNNATACVTKRTEFRGRSFRGRIYQVGCSTGQLQTGDHNLWNSTFQTALVNAWGLMRVLSVATGDATMCVVSYYSNHEPRSTGLPTPITGFTVDPTVDSQRRRLTGRGQ